MNCGLPLRSINVALAGNAIDNGAVASVRRVMGLRAWAVAASRAMLSAIARLSPMQRLLCQVAAAKMQLLNSYSSSFVAFTGAAACSAAGC